MEIIDHAWLNIEQNKAYYVDKLTFWEIPVIMYQIFVAPKFKNSLNGFVHDEIINDDYLFNKWFWNQSLLYQYTITVLYIVRKIGMKTFPYVDLSLKNILELFKRENFFEFELQ